MLKRNEYREPWIYAKKNETKVLCFVDLYFQNAIDDGLMCYYYEYIHIYLIKLTNRTILFETTTCSSVLLSKLDCSLAICSIR